MGPATVKAREAIEVSPSGRQSCRSRRHCASHSSVGSSIGQEQLCMFCNRPLITGKIHREFYTDECIRPVYMVSVHSSST